MFANVLVKATAALAAITATALLLPSTAAAQKRPVVIYAEPTSVRSELVSFARLNLATARDQKRLNRKVQAAVARVCLREFGRPRLQDRDYYDCADDAWNGATPQIAAAVARASRLASNGAAPIAAIAIRVNVR